MRKESSSPWAGLATAENAASRPLADIRVVEACNYVAGPLGAMYLADLGASVIKIEPPNGDPCRIYAHCKDGLSAIWVNSNRGKHGVVLDLKSDEGRHHLREILASADVFIENWRPRVAKALGFDHAALSAINPQLIHISVTGNGDTGPLADQPVFDSLIQASTGLVASPQTGYRSDVMPSFIADKITSVFCAQAVLAALVKRGHKGAGSHVKLSMLDSLSYFNFPDLFSHRTYLDDRQAWTPPPSPVFQTLDGFIVLSPVTGKQIAQTLDIVGCEHLKPTLKAMPDRAAMVRAFFEAIRPALLHRTNAEWLPQFRAADIPTGPVYDADEHFSDEQVLHNQLYSQLDSPVGPVRGIRYPAIFDGVMLRPELPAPGLAEHNAKIVSER